MNEQLFIQAGAEERAVVLLAEGYHPKGSTHFPRFEYSAATLGELSKFLWGDHLNTRLADEQLAISSIDAVTCTLNRATERGSFRMLGEMVDVSIGEVIGDTDYFVKSMDEWQTLRVSAGHLRPIVTRMRQLPGLQVTKKEAFALNDRVPLLLAPPARQIPKSIRRYIDSYPLEGQLSNKTFAKRSPWYKVSYDSTASAFISSLSHKSPKIVLNSAGISCANGLYKLKPRRGMGWHSCIAAASLTTVFQLSAELQARIRGAGALKLEPSDVAKLLVPVDTAPLRAAATRTLRAQLDSLVRHGEFESATLKADDALLLGSGALTVSELSLIRGRLQDLREERLSSRPRRR